MECAVCKTIDAEKERLMGTDECFECKAPLHRSCVPVRSLRSGCLLCPKCPTEQGLDSEDELNGTIIETAASSTRINPKEKDLEKRVRELEGLLARQESAQNQALKTRVAELENMVKSLHERAPNNSGSLAGTQLPPPPSNVGNQFGVAGTNNESGEQRNRSDRASFSQGNETMWRSRLPTEVLERSVAPAPLTRDQLARRKAMDTALPKFNGDQLRGFTSSRPILTQQGSRAGLHPGMMLREWARLWKGQRSRRLKGG